MIEYTQIPLKALEINSWYIGRGRGGNLGRWNGECFVTICFYDKSWSELQAIKQKIPVTESMRKSREVIKYEYYFYKDKVSKPKGADLGTFQPFLKVDFGEIVGEKYDSSYGEKLRFK